jgi:protein gp37
MNKSDSIHSDWWDVPWNPSVGCSHKSPACDHCWAAGFASRELSAEHSGLTKKNAKGIFFNGVFKTLPHRLDMPDRWKKPLRIFAGNMTDSFHEKMPLEFLQQMFETMNRNAHHTFMMLTKRPENVLKIMDKVNWSPNIWLGVTCENQQYANERIPLLLRTPARIKFLSCEPLLGKISLDLDDMNGKRLPTHRGIDWVICGGEGGKKNEVRPTQPNWVRSLRDDCCANIPFYFKQWGNCLPLETHKDGQMILQTDPLELHEQYPSFNEVIRCQFIFGGKKKNGRMLDGSLYNEFPA